MRFADAPRKRLNGASRASSRTAEIERVFLMPTKWGKCRNPIAVALLSAATLGAYFIYWHYAVNEEIAICDPKIEERPWVSAIAVSPIGWILFFIPGLVSVYDTGARCLRMFRDSGSSQIVSPRLSALLFLIGGLGMPPLQLFYPPYFQAKLNSFWLEEAARSAGAEEAYSRSI